MADKRMPIKKYNSEAERLFAIYTQRVNRQLDLILEKMELTEKRRDQKFSELEKSLNEFKYDVQNQFKEVNAQFKIIREYLGRIDEQIQDLRRRLERKADRARLDKLEEEVAKLKSIIKELQKKNKR
ncbi:MAG: hypothetical protein Q8P45_02625 [Candidatus Harrisonbacteria bacterium]|nr:hypothetical protein [Candidatus Harrisonbacteria bacterium]